MMDFRLRVNWVQYATLPLIPLAVLGPILPGIQFLDYNIFPFRTYLIIYIPAFAIFIYNSDLIEINYSTILFFYFTLFSLLTVILSTLNGISVEGLVLNLINFFIFLAIVLTLRNRKWIYRAWTILLLLSLLSFAVIMIELQTDWHVHYSQLHQTSDRPPFNSYVSAWYKNINDLSFFLVLSTIPAIVKSLYCSNLLKRFFWISVWVIAFCISIHLNARTAMFGFVIVASTTIGIVYSNSLQTVAGNLSIRIGQTLIILIGFLVYPIFLYIPNPFSSAGSSLWVRWQLQKAAVSSGGLTGNGLGSVITTMNESSISTGGISSPHSWFGTIVSETGAVGYVLFLAFYGAVLANILQKVNTRDPICIMGAVAIIVLPVAGLGPSNGFLMPEFWITLGLVVSTTHIY